MNIENINQYRKLYFNRASRHVRDLANPLIKHGISHFSYSSINRKGEEELLTTHVDSSLHFYKIQAYNHMFFGDVDRYTSEIALWNDLLPKTNSGSQFIVDQRELFNIDHGVVITKKLKDQVRFYFFAGSRDDHHLYSFYLNNLNLLDSFIEYFHAEGAELLLGANQDRYKIRGSGDQSILTSSEEKCPKTFDLSSISKTFRLTSRELECLSILRYGSSFEEVGRALSIAERTVKAHVASAKKKMGCRSLIQLGFKIKDHLNDE